MFRFPFGVVIRLLGIARTYAFYLGRGHRGASWILRGLASCEEDRPLPLRIILLPPRSAWFFARGPASREDAHARNRQVPGEGTSERWRAEGLVSKTFKLRRPPRARGWGHGEGRDPPTAPQGRGPAAGPRAVPARRRLGRGPFSTPSTVEAQAEGVRLWRM
ncbi:unnamed protein product [Prorocentrum cordatum]|uniref:Uncharacterized protein n=1 Tax=Prorocentrum cordatum TaxID=2364126 RepID=A0ABN9TPK9_9DINO|nr:unnamed protein product [Polarella glacialis]